MLDWILTNNGFMIEAVIMLAVIIYVGTRM
ncbi:hypothetical protein SAMN05421760_1086 [Neptunomonas antarctica]|uniref:Uncharacterized protein n=1 Tax=Neptunomonas antarctica TaxID=619304 RepID=A0A1N7N392_9GAMM|nr:hypothetical protein SAMN05421760_1086 [Neptunomonas antarctica]